MIYIVSDEAQKEKKKKSLNNDNYITLTFINWKINKRAWRLTNYAANTAWLLTTI